jgi:DNA-binding NarL/FixJ family response regulator
VDDHAAVVAGLRDVLSDLYAVTVENSGADALSRVTNDEYDVLVLDYYIGPVTCVRIAEVAKTRFPGTKICVLTRYLNAEVMGSLAHIQPEAVLDKSSSAPELLQTIGKVIAGERVYTPEAVTMLMTLIAGRSPTQQVKGAGLSDAEQRVLALTAQGHSASEIAEAMALSVAYVNLIRRDLKRRFNVRSMAQLITLYHSTEHLL